MIPNYEPQLRPTFPQATTNPNYDQLRQKQTHAKNVAIATNYPTTNPNYDQLRPLRRPATTTAPPLKGVPVVVGTDRVDAEKTDQSQTTKNRSPRKKNPTRKKPLVTQTITACPGQTRHPKSKITTATHTSQAVAPSGTPTCKPHRHRQAAFGDTPTLYRIEQARKQPDLVAASANRYE